jgi:ATP-dependent Clp protease ATP-binding subunit ClpC
MYERFTDRARKVMHLANQEAQRLNHEYLGTEHVLVGITKEGGGIACHALKLSGVGLDEVIRRVRDHPMAKPGPYMVTMGKLPFTARVKAVIGRAVDEARRLGHDHVGTGHLLLGLLRGPGGVAGDVLVGLGVDCEVVLSHVERLMALPAKGEPWPGGGAPAEARLAPADLADGVRRYAVILHGLAITDDQTRRIRAILAEGPVVPEEKSAEPPKAETGTWRDKPSML